MSTAERLVVALVRGIHGLHGAVRVEVLTDRPEERFARDSVLYREGSAEPLHVLTATEIPDGPGWRLRFAEVPDRTSAEGLRDTYLEAVAGPEDHNPRGAYYWHEVIGATVRDTAGRELGTVHDVYRVGEAEVFVVRGEPFGEFDVPAVRAFIRIFAPRRGEIVVDADALGLEPPKPRRTTARRTTAPRSTARETMDAQTRDGQTRGGPIGDRPQTTRAARPRRAPRASGPTDA